MSDSVVFKENISYRKKRVPETSSGPTLSQQIAFAHKFVGGESSFSLLSLTTPTAEMPGFTNPSPAVLAGQNLAGNPTALKLFYMVTGARLAEFDSYRCTGTTITFLNGLIMPAGAIIYGEVTALAANPIVVGDGRFLRKTYSLAAGTATINTGFTFKVGTNLGTSDQVGDIKVTRNGVVQFRNVGNAVASPTADGNYQEVDAGNGYGTQIVFNTAASGNADAVMIEMGFQISSGQMQIWSELERQQGAILALATDAATGFGNPVTNYLNATPTELDRRAFGDTVAAAAKLIPQVAGLLAPTQSQATSGYYNLPGGLLLQWGEVSFIGNHGQNYSFNFNIPFPNNCFQAYLIPGNTVNTVQSVVYTPITGKTLTGYSFQWGSVSGNSYATTVRWFAIGN